MPSRQTRPAGARLPTRAAVRVPRRHLLDGEVRWLAERQDDLAIDEILPCVCAATGDLRLARARVGG